MVSVHQKLSESLQGEWEIALMTKSKVHDWTGAIQQLAKHPENTAFESSLQNKLRSHWEHYTTPPYFVSPNNLHPLVHTECQPELQTFALRQEQKFYLGF